MACGAPNPTLGTAQRYAEWFDCNARTIGQEGYLGLASYVTSSGILAGILTIFVALIGYRLLLGGKLDLSDGVSWAAKVGIVLALLAGWSAFQAIFYQLAIAGPGELSSRVLVASGIPGDDTAMRTQRVYDALRLGLNGTYFNEETGDPLGAQPSLPGTAILFLLATVGAIGGAKLLAGFLLAIAPVPIGLMLFGPGMGLFVGWVRALATAIIAIVGLSISSHLCVLALESEISRMQTYTVGRPGMMDQQAPLAIAGLFFLIAVAIPFLSAKMSGGLAERLWKSEAFGWKEAPSTADRELKPASAGGSPNEVRTRYGAPLLSSTDEGRTSRLASAFERTDRIGHNRTSVGARDEMGLGWAGGSLAERSVPRSGRGSASRRALGRRHRSALRRDRIE